MSVLEYILPDLKSLHRKRFVWILVMFNLMPILYSIQPFIKDSTNLSDWYLCAYFMFIGGLGSAFFFGANYWGMEGYALLLRFNSSHSIKKVTYYKIMLSVIIFLIVMTGYSLLIFWNFQKLSFEIISIFVATFVFILSYLPMCFSYLSVKFCASTYSNWLYPNRPTPSFVNGLQLLFAIFTPFAIPALLFYMFEGNEYIAIVIIFSLSALNFIFLPKVIDKITMIFYKERMTILNKLISKVS